MSPDLIVIVLGVILVSMTLHEVMHGYVAYLLGDDTAKHLGRLTLNPVKHIDPVLTILLPLIMIAAGGPVFGGAKPVPFNPNRIRYEEWGVALVAIAGPLTNLVIAFVAFGVGVIGGVITADGVLVSTFGMIVQTFVTVNLGFMVFNMIPLPPLDGSRVLYALAPEFVRRGMEAVEQFGLLFIFSIILLANSLIISYVVQGVNFFMQVFGWVFGLG